ncbi:MAG: hypothetical protein CMJ69_07910 [Planctomycetaceae bacterium]|nr:hypothetical protein [Planctomycetaceae bacterium]
MRTRDFLSNAIRAITIVVAALLSPSWTRSAPPENKESFRPRILAPRRSDSDLQTPELEPAQPASVLVPEFAAPFGFSGPSGVLPREDQQGSHFVPIEDRWRLGMPAWDRYGKEHPPVDDYPGVLGRWWDPYNLNVLKGDYPLVGQDTFLTVTGISQLVQELREVPTGTTPFESTLNPFSEEFFGDPEQFFSTNFFRLSVDLFNGSAGYKQPVWRMRATPVFNFNYLDVNELAVVSPDVRDGTTRFRTDWALDDWFLEAKLADLGPEYDFVSVRGGSQFFVSDFRGFVFSDTNRAVRLFGSRFSNRDQFNVLWFDQTEKETNSELNLFDDRHQNTVIANYYHQDFLVPGYTGLLSFHYNNDQPGTKFDRNRFLVRPDPAGVFQPHRVEAYYLGLAGQGHFGHLNVSNAFYYVWGRDSLNPIAGRDQNIEAQMSALELSYDRDWARFRVSWFWASGDPDPNDGDAEGFDAIFDNPNFAGGEFSYWQRQAIRLFGVGLTQRQSLMANLRSSKTQGQSNFVNPGLSLINAGMDMDVTPKLKLVANANFLWFDDTKSLEVFTFQDKIDSEIGTDLSLGIEYRPYLNDNVQLISGLSSFIPARGFKDLYTPFNGKVETLFGHFLEVILTY